MHRPRPPPPTLVADPGGLAALVERLRAEPVVAVDTESNSFHVYRERICLVQISTRAEDYIVDPFAVDVAPLGAVLCDGRETVLHGADYDVRCMRREYGWALPRLFDTMAAARRLGRAGLGLSALVEAHFGVRLSKANQRSDWGRRPLSREQIAYAALDTHYLLPLRDLLAGELDARGALEGARREFDRIAGAEPRERVFDAEGWRRLKGARELDGPGRDVLAALWRAREEAARASDRPPFKVLAEATMLEIARRRPATPPELERLPGVTPSVMRRMGEAILSALAAAPVATGS
ncbi:MAG TPA: ribonuclease D [Anaeromyxobacter sp.]|nr:ribonuclease D [Anaeromyxobacter sp.]